MLLALAGLAACSTVPNKPTPLDVEPASAWVAPGRIVLAMGDQNAAYLTAHWSDESCSECGFRHYAAPLEIAFEPADVELEQLAVASDAAWAQVNRDVLDALIPTQAMQGVIVRVRLVDLVVYRDHNGEVVSAPLEAIPADVEVVERVADEQFLDLVVRHLRERGYRGQTLWMTGRVGAPAVYTDLERGEVVLILAPPDPELATGLDTLEFSLASINSVVVRSHLLTLLNNPVTTVSRLIAYAGTTTLAFANTEITQVTAPPPIADRPGMAIDEWEQALDEMVESPTYDARLSYLIDGDEFFPELFRAFNGARKFINVQVFIFDLDDFAVRVAKRLKTLSNTVKVKVLMDDLGSLVAGNLPPETPPPPGFEPPSSIESFLEDGSRVRARVTSNPWFTADHTKRIIVDDEVAFIGGMNIGREYRSEWHDLMVKIEGPLVKRINNDFRLAWAHAGVAGDLAYAWRKLKPLPKPTGAADKDWIKVRPLYTTTGDAEIFRTQMAAIERAQQRIYVQNAYIADDAILRGLIEARHRGVDVRVIFPTRADSGIMHASNVVTANALLANGIRVYLYPGMTHVKAALFDGWACLGTANFDKISLFVNQEVNLGFSDPDTVEQLNQRLFQADFAISNEVTEPVDVGWSDYLWEFLANQL